MYDLAVIGGGPGGYVAAIRGAQHGLKVLLVEKKALGGTCLNQGCIPTKCFVYDSKLFRAAKTSTVLKGTDSLSIDPQKMLARKRSVVNTMVNGLDGILKSHGIDIVNGEARLLDPNKLLVKTAGKPANNYSARNIILATGSRPSIPPFVTVDGHYVQTTDEVLDTDELPNKIIIVGGGVIGIEMATIFLNLGLHVTILEMLPDILCTEDLEIRTAMRRLLSQRGAEVHIEAKAKNFDITNGKVWLTFEDAQGAEHTIEAGRLLVATGRAPVLDGIDTKFLALAKEGPYIKVDDQLKTNLPGVYAIGDLVGGMMLAHKASAEAEVAVENILGRRKKINQRYIPRCIWGLEEIGAVGLNEEDAGKMGRRIKIGRFPYSASGAAMAMGSSVGFAKIIADEENGEILGLHLIGEHATDLVGYAVTTMTMESVVEDLAEVIQAHPTLSETVMEAAMDWNALAIHMPKKVKTVTIQ